MCRPHGRTRHRRRRRGSCRARAAPLGALCGDARRTRAALHPDPWSPSPATASMRPSSSTWASTVEAIVSTTRRWSARTRARHHRTPGSRPGGSCSLRGDRRQAPRLRDDGTAAVRGVSDDVLPEGGQLVVEPEERQRRCRPCRMRCSTRPRAGRRPPGGLGEHPGDAPVDDEELFVTSSSQGPLSTGTTRGPAPSGRSSSRRSTSNWASSSAVGTSVSSIPGSPWMPRPTPCGPRARRRGAGPPPAACREKATPKERVRSFADRATRAPSARGSPASSAAAAARKTVRSPAIPRPLRAFIERGAEDVVGHG